MDLKLQCRCGRLALRVKDVSPAVANRVTCHCQGCRAFARRMAPEILDPHGGTERFQVRPDTVAFETGREHLAGLQQTPRGAFRYYAACCQTPLGLTLRKDSVPFIGLDLHTVVEPQGSLDKILGPMRARVNGRFPRANRRALKADVRSLLSMLWHLTPLVWRWWRAGVEHPLWRDGEPIVEIEQQVPAPRALMPSRGCR